MLSISLLPSENYDTWACRINTEIFRFIARSNRLILKCKSNYSIYSSLIFKMLQKSQTKVCTILNGIFKLLIPDRFHGDRCLIHFKKSFWKLFLNMNLAIGLDSLLYTISSLLTWITFTTWYFLLFYSFQFECSSF